MFACGGDDACNEKGGRRVDGDEFVANQPTLKQEEDFRDWFTDMAYPWRTDFKNSEGAKVSIRMVPNEP